MKTNIKWLEEMQFVGQSGSGHSVVLDSPDNGMGVSPMEMLLMGLGGCTSFDVVSILKKAHQKIEDCRVEVDADRAEEPPRVFTRIRIKYTVSGYELNENQVHRAIELSRTKFCGASIMMEKSGAQMKHSVEIIQL